MNINLSFSNFERICQDHEHISNKTSLSIMYAIMFDVLKRQHTCYLLFEQMESRKSWMQNSWQLAFSTLGIFANQINSPILQEIWRLYSGLVGNLWTMEGRSKLQTVFGLWIQVIMINVLTMLWNLYDGTLTSRTSLLQIQCFSFSILSAFSQSNSPPSKLKIHSFYSENEETISCLHLSTFKPQSHTCKGWDN